jgi:hypothetical protein
MDRPASEEAAQLQALVVCYTSGLDLRRVDDESTPFIAEQLRVCPWQRFVNLPSNELYPTLVTGVDPTLHGRWGVRLESAGAASWRGALAHLLPDAVTTTFQSLLHLLTRSYDLAAIPPRRRRQFAITRSKYQRRLGRPEALVEIGGVPSIFSVIGAPRCRYRFSSAMDPMRSVLRDLCSGPYVVEMLELYSLDRFQQWNLDRPSAVRAYYRRIDDFLRALDAKCRATGRSLMLLSDHGHEAIRASVDLRQRLRALGLPRGSYSFFTEVSNARFWFHSEDARRAITQMLSEIDNGMLLGYGEMHRYGVPLKDASYGEAFFYLDPGHIFFPHDFHHALANLWLGLVDPMQRSRLRDPRHKGNHGHLPHFDTENAFLALLDPRFEVVVERASVLDVAPSILDVLGYEPAAGMSGRAIFRRARLQNGS